jgi:hypothetical protein
MTLIRKIITLAFLLFGITMQAQNDELNLRKYWFYRYRMMSDFVVKGDCQGCSEIINEREHKYRTFPVATPTEIAKWGDQSFNLGEYIAILATEFKLEYDRGQPTDTTLQELCYAMRAFNRIDQTAEHYFAVATNRSHPIVDDDLNGFWIRDDVPESFLNDHPQLKDGLFSTHHVEHVDSDFQNAMALAPMYNDKTFLMSHDQIYPILMGMALVRRYLYSGVNYNNIPLNNVNSNTDIYLEAAQITNRIINYLHHSDPLLNWTLVNPFFTGPSDYHWANMQGYQARQLAYPIAETGCYVQNLNTSPNPPFVYPPRSCSDYHDNSSMDEAVAWNEAGRHYPIPLLGYEEFKVEINAALSNSWWTSMFPGVIEPAGVLGVLGTFEWPPSWEDVLSVFEASVGYPVNITESELALRADQESNQYLPLLRKLLHGGGNPIPSSYYKFLLDVAPCNGPYNFSASGGGMSTYEWSARDRLHTADERGGFVSSPDHEGSSQGEYPGLDYMLYYNLYAIAYGPGTSYINYMDRKVGITFPHTIPSPGPLGGSVAFSGPPGLIVGNLTFPAAIEAFHSIDANNLLTTEAVVDYRAGKQIHLGPGFHATSGCQFHAYIDPFECASDGEYRASTGNPVNNDNMATAVAYNGPTSFVNYPNKVSGQEYITEAQPAAKPSGSAQEVSQNISNVTVSSQKPIVEPEINIYPNPNNGSFTIEFLKEEETTTTKTITVLNIYGIAILEQQTTNSAVTIDITDQSKGIYYVRIDNHAKTKMKKIVYQ